jgi:hypothetical protein
VRRVRGLLVQPIQPANAATRYVRAYLSFKLPSNPQMESDLRAAVAPTLLRHMLFLRPTWRRRTPVFLMLSNLRGRPFPCRRATACINWSGPRFWVGRIAATNPEQRPCARVNLLLNPLTVTPRFFSSISSTAKLQLIQPPLRYAKQPILNSRCAQKVNVWNVKADACYRFLKESRMRID